MFKKLLTFVMALALIFAFTLPAQAASKNMWAYVYTWDGGYNADGTIKLTRQTSGITFKVLQADSNTAETLTVYDSSTSLTNPVTTSNYESATVCNDRVAFRVDPGHTDDEYVDLIVTDTDGMFSIFYENFDQYTHTIVIDARPGKAHIGIIWYTATTTNAVDTGIDFRTGTLINDCRVEVVTVCPGGTIDVGFGLSAESGYDVDGLRDGVATDVLGIPTDTGIVTSGTSIEYYPDSTYGDLLYTIIAGAGTVTGELYWSETSHEYHHAYDTGGRSFLGHWVSAVNPTQAVSLTYTRSSSTSVGAGYIYIEHMRLR